MYSYTVNVFAVVCFFLAIQLHKLLYHVAANEDFRPVLQLLTLPVGSSSGSTRCMPVYIIDDTEPETSEEFTLTLFVSDVAVVIAQESTIVVIQDNDGGYEHVSSTVYLMKLVTHDVLFQMCFCG